MRIEVNKWIRIVLEAWHSLVDDFENFGPERGYGHMREEDIRSYLFCKISEVMQKRGEWLFELHAEQPLPEERADIVVGTIDDVPCVGVEIKQSGQQKPLTNDLNKLCSFMKNGEIKSGILAVITEHYEYVSPKPYWESVFKAWDFPERFKLEPKDIGKNNYWEIRELKEITIENKIKKLDSLLFVLRKL
jgi:hypothetical protein